jgi:peptide deformylase
MIKIVQKEDPVLRKIAKEVSEKEIGSKEIKKVLADMSRALLEQDDGVAIAAPQIGVSKRIFVVSGKIFEEDFTRGQGSQTHSNTPTHKDLVFINPIITKISKDKKSLQEGCLSVRWLYGKTKRATSATVEAMDENGQTFEYKGRGLMAQIFQHEIDHLNGILFHDHAKDVKDIPPENSRDKKHHDKK